MKLAFRNAGIFYKENIAFFFNFNRSLVNLTIFSKKIQSLTSSVAESAFWLFD